MLLLPSLFVARDRDILVHLKDLNFVKMGRLIVLSVRRICKPEK